MAQIDDRSNPLNDKLDMQQLDLMLRQIESLPTLPSVASRLLELSTRPRAEGSGTSAQAEMAKLISLDQSLTARLLALANRSSPGSVSTVEHALRLLGEETVRGVVLSVQVFQTFERPPKGSALDRPAFWRHCLAVASATEMVAARLGLSAGAQAAFACGLLHDVGKLAAEQRLPKTYRRVLEALANANGNIADFERQVLGMDHSIIGRRLAEHWQLPRIVQQAIWLHHQPWESLPPSLPGRMLVAAVTLGDTIARELRIGFSGNYTFVRSSSQLAGQIGLSPEALQDIVRGLPAQIAERAALLGLEQSDSESIYREALSNSNAELARLNEQLRLRGRQLQAQAAAFDLLRDFAASLRAEATVSDVLSKAAEILSRCAVPEPAGSSAVVAYSIHEEPPEVLAVRLDASGAQWRVLRRPKNPLSGGGEGSQATAKTVPSESSADAIASLVEQAADLDEWVDVLEMRHRPLVCARRWIGGAFLPRGTPSWAAGGEGAFWRQTEEAISGALALALAIVQGREHATRLSEQIASASQVLASAHEALSDAKTLSAIGQMAAGAAHEINNPLAVISGRAQIMVTKAAGEEDRNTWQMIAQQSQRISDIITDLMEFASPPAPAPEIIDAGDLLRDAVQAFAASGHPKAASATVDIQVGPDVKVFADRAQVRSVMLELMSNAATAAKDQAVIHLGALGEAQGTALLSVRDEGPGMDQQTSAQVFTPFFSSQQAGRRRGLGLPRARRYVESNGGQIWIQTMVNEGTTVFVRLGAPQASQEDADVRT